MSKQVATYVSEEQRKRWKKLADKREMSLSEWVKAMTEAGLKKFDRQVSPDQTKAELREKCRQFMRDLQDARERIQTLERQVVESERESILKFIRENPGASYQEIVQHIINTTSGRVTKLLTEMDGEEVVVDKHGRVTPRGEKK